jgi:hypothetical protein
LAVMASYGIDALRLRAVGRGCLTALLTVGLAPWPVLAVFVSLRPEASREYERFAVVAIAALAISAVLYGWKWKRLSERTAIVLLSITALFELGTVTGQGFRHRESPGGYLQLLDQNADVVAFLRRQPDFVRLDVDTDVVPYNIGDWYGIDQYQAYLGGVTSNLVPFGIDMLGGGRLANELFGLNYAVGRKAFRSGQVEVFQGSSGLNVYRNPEAFPRLWTVHQISSVSAGDLVSRLKSAGLRHEVLLTAPGPELERCTDADDVKLLHRDATHIAIAAHMGCQGMIIVSQTYYPGWEATVDGHPASLYEVYGALQGITAAEGIHRIDVHYRPLSVYWGSFLTAAGLGASLVLAVAARKRAST